MTYCFALKITSEQNNMKSTSLLPPMIYVYFCYTYEIYSPSYTFYLLNVVFITIYILTAIQTKKNTVYQTSRSDVYSPNHTATNTKNKV